MQAMPDPALQLVAKTGPTGGLEQALAQSFLKRVETKESIFAEGDLATRLIRVETGSIACARFPRTVGEDTPLENVVRIMQRKNVKRVPVLQQEAKLVGIITGANLLHAIACLAEKSQPVARGDA